MKSFSRVEFKQCVVYTINFMKKLTLIRRGIDVQCIGYIKIVVDGLMKTVCDSMELIKWSNAILAVISNEQKCD
jgi:hypothetical protein